MDNPKTDDPVNPRHYRDLHPEPIDVIEAWELGFHLGCAVKYIARAGRKQGEHRVIALRKAMWYIQRHIELATRTEQSEERP